MASAKISYHKAADQFLQLQYEHNSRTELGLMHRFTQSLVTEARTIAKSSGLRDMDYQDVMVATWFYYADLSQLTTVHTDQRAELLSEYFNSVVYPYTHRTVVAGAIETVSENRLATTQVQQVLSDAIYSQFAQSDFIEKITLLKDELNESVASDHDELAFLHYYKQLFSSVKYYTQHAFEHYAVQRERNLQLLEKRIRKLEEGQQPEPHEHHRAALPVTITDKEAEELFKLAFRNYNHLISVADSKASLLIRVNSTIISVMLAFVLGKIQKNTYSLWPVVLILAVSSVTIILAVLASKPQQSRIFGDRASHTSPRFFFGSFDLVDRSFRHAGWDSYLVELKEYLSGSREMIFMEVYKETFNVRKVLAKKFNYLSIAYWVFLIGLLLSVSAFIFSLEFEGTA